MIALDCETTGLDHWHGATPFLVTTCSDKGEVLFYEWDVDPYTRKVSIPQDDIDDIQLLLMSQQHIVGQNIKFDAHALLNAGIVNWSAFWDITEDTINGAHLLDSSQFLGLDRLVLRYITWKDVDIRPYEEKLKKCVMECRRLVQQARLKVKRYGKDHPDSELAKWAIAEKGRPDMPSAKEETWKFDSWLPRAMAKRLGRHPSCEWWTACQEYANADSTYTLAVWKVIENMIKEKKLWPNYRESMKLTAALWRMERRGVTVNLDVLNKMEKEYVEESANEEAVCVNIALSKFNYDLKMPKRARNNSLTHFLFGDGNGNKYLDLPVVARTASGGPSLETKIVQPIYADILPRGSVQAAFVSSLFARTKRATYAGYLASYKKFGLPLKGHNGWLLLHPSINQTGTDTLRKSSSNPNEQNIGKQVVDDMTLRDCFGPPPGWYWLSMDAENIELRIPAFVAGEQALIDVFLKPNEPPYFGSYHLVMFDAVYPELFAKHGYECKTLFEDTYYQWIKNFDFALIYGCQEKTGDRAAHKEGAWRQVRSRFPKIAQLSDKMIESANKRGYVETLPIKGVTEKGYPISTRRVAGKISPTVPLNYFVQSTASEWERNALVKVDSQHREWNKQGFNSYLTLDVHDELVSVMPCDPQEAEPWRNDLDKILVLKQLMESCGDQIGVPTPVSVEYHSTESSWAKGKKINVLKEIESCKKK